MTKYIAILKGIGGMRNRQKLQTWYGAGPLDVRAVAWRYQVPPDFGTGTEEQ